MKNKLIPVLLISLMIVSCKEGNQEPKETVKNMPAEKLIQAPSFNADSAYQFINAQVNFGPRVPGTKAHAQCADYLAAKLKSYGFEVQVPKYQNVQTYDKKQFYLKNIIGAFKPELTSRIMICSHWDTRPFCESDSINPDKPGDGANDGASGVGVALEIARQVQLKNPLIGVDIIYFDLEDYGENGNNESWCLGSKYWSTHLHRPGYFANFGILLDMVGGPNATFVKEGISVEKASAVVDAIWNTAGRIGYGNYFINQTRNFIGADDHVPVNDNARIPCIDIIQYDMLTNSFPSYHHTHNDNMSMIDKKTLKAVGQTLMQVIYSEK